MSNIFSNNKKNKKVWRFLMLYCCLLESTSPEGLFKIVINYSLQKVPQYLNMESTIRFYFFPKDLIVVFIFRSSDFIADFKTDGDFLFTLCDALNISYTNWISPAQIELRLPELNVITCVNWTSPAGIEPHLYEAAIS